jgi:hypothetical protein
LLAAKAGEAISTRVAEMNEQDLMPGDVSIAVSMTAWRRSPLLLPT